MSVVQVFWLMDALTVRTCSGAVGGCPSSRTAAMAGNACTDAGGVCEVCGGAMVFFPQHALCR